MTCSRQPRNTGQAETQPLQPGVLIEIFHLLTAQMRHFASYGLGSYLVALKMNLDWDQSRVRNTGNV
jgi:hypothetical protein